MAGLWARTGLHIIILTISCVTCQGSPPSVRHRDNNGYPGNVIQQRAGEELPSLRLPQLLQIIMKYGMLKFWNIQTGPNWSGEPRDRKACTDDQIRTLHDKCKLRQLYAAFGAKSMKNNQNSDIRSALGTICSHYDEFRSCTRMYGLDECHTADKVSVNIIWDYICHQGKELLLGEDEAGVCLRTKISRKSVLKQLNTMDQCHNAFSDATNIIQSTLSIYHAHDSGELDTQNPAIKQNLFRLCKTWYTLEHCILPAYGVLCGQSAQSFYHQFVGILKKSLADEFSHLGPDFLRLATCDDVTGRHVINVTEDAPSVSGFGTYMNNQANGYFNTASRLMILRGECDRFTQSMIFPGCFWRSVAGVGPAILPMASDLRHNGKLLADSVVRPVERCIEGYTRNCAPDHSLNLTTVLDALAEVFQNSEAIFSCMDVMSLDSVSQSACGLTISDIASYYIFQGSLTYTSAQSTCSNNIPFQKFPNLSCIADMLTNIHTGQDDESSCVQTYLPMALRLVRGVDDVMVEASSFFTAMYREIC